MFRSSSRAPSSIRRGLLREIERGLARRRSKRCDTRSSTRSSENTVGDLGVEVRVRAVRADDVLLEEADLARVDCD
jgi:hypothetical protein